VVLQAPMVSATRTAECIWHCDDAKRNELGVAVINLAFAAVVVVVAAVVVFF
jgi:hypothetical protein